MQPPAIKMCQAENWCPRAVNACTKAGSAASGEHLLGRKWAELRWGVLPRTCFCLPASPPSQQLPLADGATRKEAPLALNLWPGDRGQLVQVSEHLVASKQAWGFLIFLLPVMSGKLTPFLVIVTAPTPLLGFHKCTSVSQKRTVSRVWCIYVKELRFLWAISWGFFWVLSWDGGDIPVDWGLRLT